MDLKKMEIGPLILLWNASDKNGAIKSKIEDEFNIRIQDNTYISREYVFNVCKMKNHAISVFFIPTSEAFKVYGRSLTIDMVLTDEEIIQMTKNLHNIQTQGFIKAKVLVKDNLSDEQIEYAFSTGFHTNNVYEVIHI